MTIHLITKSASKFIGFVSKRKILINYLTYRVFVTDLPIIKSTSQNVQSHTSARGVDY